jgi:SHS2 domain-containing protein
MIMGSFRLLDHPADIGFEACGATVREMFEMAVQALASLIVEPEGVRETLERPLELLAGDREQLLVRFLSEVLYLFDAEKFVPRSASVRAMNDCSMTVVLKGETFDPQRHSTKLDVKAITYHQLAIEKTDQGYCARVFVDV